MTFSDTTKTVIGLVVLTLAVVGMTAVGTAATVEIANKTATFDNSSNVTVSVDWNDSASNSSTADVEFYHADAYALDGDDETHNLSSTTLNGTTAEFIEGNVTTGTDYDIELNQSSTTVTVAASNITNGTVDLSNHTSSNITSGDEILSVTAHAQLVVSDAISAEPGNTTETEYTEADGLEDGTEYYISVTVTDSEVDSATIDAGALGGFFGGSDGSPGFGIVTALVAIAAAAGVARRRGVS